MKSQLGRAGGAPRVTPAAIAAASILSLFGAVDLVANGFKLDVYAVILLGLAVVVLMSAQISRLKLGPGGVEAETREIARRVEETASSVDRLRKELRARGHSSVLEQVSTMNRLVMTYPSLGRLWSGMEDLTDEEIREIFYIYVFLDTFEMLRLFTEGEPLGKEFYEIWRTTWIPELLSSRTGQRMEEAGLLKYYPPELRKAVGLDSAE